MNEPHYFIHLVLHSPTPPICYFPTCLFFPILSDRKKKKRPAQSWFNYSTSFPSPCYHHGLDLGLTGCCPGHSHGRLRHRNPPCPPPAEVTVWFCSPAPGVCGANRSSVFSASSSFLYIFWYVFSDPLLPSSIFMTKDSFFSGYPFA